MKLKALNHPVIGNLVPDQWGDALMFFRQIPGLADFAPENSREALESLDPAERKLVESWSNPSRELIEHCRDGAIFESLRGLGVYEVEFARTAAGKPADDQVAAYRNFVANEAAVCQNMKSALLRYYGVARANDPQWFEQNGCPTVESVAELSKLAFVDGVSFTNRACEGEALVTINWQVEWDVEHGCSITLWKGEVVGFGSEDEFEDDFLWDESMMTEPERQTRARVLTLLSEQEDEDFDDDFDDEDDDE